MHELNCALMLCESIEESAQQGDPMVCRVKVKVGLARGVRPKKLRKAFDWAKKDTVAKNVTLEVEIVPIRVRCTLCDHIYASDVVFAECPFCGSLGGQIMSGNEFCIDRVELEHDARIKTGAAGAQEYAVSPQPDRVIQHS